MRLLEEIERRIAREQSLFLAQLLREDLARLGRLLELAAVSADRAQFGASGRRLGWTPGDARTAELGPLLDRFLDAFFEAARGDAGEVGEERLRTAWLELAQARVERFVGCLSTRVPKPDA